MKKTILTLIISFFSMYGFSQWNPNGNSITNAIFRTGSVGIGYTALPSFGGFKMKVKGKSHFENGTIVIGEDIPNWAEQNIPNFWFGIKSSRPIIVQSNDPMYNSIDVIGNNGAFIQMATAKCNGCYSALSVPQDVVLRGFSSTSLIIANEGNGDIKFETGNGNATPRTTNIQMRIDNIGNVGIGMGSNPIPATDKLAVNGLIHTKEVKVDLTGWPDYVFDAKYKLPTLEEVEKNIKEKGHLSNIPSALEVENNGALLGEMNKKLLEKVEELTLYIIQMNKEIELLKAKK